MSKNIQVDASMGSDDFAQLSPKTRKTAKTRRKIKKVLSYLEKQ